MKLLILTQRKGQNDCSPCIVEISAISAITTGSDGRGGYFTRVHVGEPIPIPVRETPKEIMEILAKSGAVPPLGADFWTNLTLKAEETA
ncbi:MAG: hypothetical protein WBL20_07820 [Sphingobium sp.]|uniref:hypothetical protein n=1 Tax=Sphingobium sp. TaxID=1912891 RepID=UPI003BAFDFA1